MNDNKAPPDRKNTPTGGNQEGVLGCNQFDKAESHTALIKPVLKEIASGDFSTLQAVTDASGEIVLILDGRPIVDVPLRGQKVFIGEGWKPR